MKLNVGSVLVWPDAAPPRRPPAESHHSLEVAFFSGDSTRDSDSHHLLEVALFSRDSKSQISQPPTLAFGFIDAAGGEAKCVTITSVHYYH